MGCSTNSKSPNRKRLPDQKLNNNFYNIDLNSDQNNNQLIQNNNNLDKKQSLLRAKTQKIINLNREYFFQSQEINQPNQPNNIELDSPKEKIELFTTILFDNYNDIDYLNQYNHNLSLIFYLKSKNENNYSALGQTKNIYIVDQSTLIDSSFVFDYYFEVQQHLKVEILINNKYLSTIETVVGKIMGTRGQKLEFNFTLPNMGTNYTNTNSIEGRLKFVIVPVKSSDEEIIFDLTARLNMKNNHPILCPYFTIKRNIDGKSDSHSSEHWVKIYKSEVLMDTNFKTQIPDTYNNNTGLSNVYKYQTANFTVQNLNNNDYTKPIQIEFYNYGNGNEVLLGSQTNILQAFTNFHKMELDENLIDNLNNKDLLINCQYVKKYKFLDYLRGGLQITTIIGIDFTISNEEPYKEISLHYTGICPNLYEKAIQSCLRIISSYNTEQLYPTFGFGAKINNVVNHCFNLNQSMYDPNIKSVEGVMNCYREYLSIVKLWTPTHFAPLVNQTNDIVRDSDNPDLYYILLILTDGIINDLEETKNAVVEASFLPISIIIIGIGPGGSNGFEEMDVLDADTNPLYNSNGVKAARDLVQFVEFNKFMNDEHMLAANVLEEVPRQVEEYYKMKNKPPNDPIKDFNDNNI